MMNDRVLKPGTCYSLQVPSSYDTIRIDSYLSTYFSKYSRTFFKKLIDDGLIICNGTIVKKPSFSLKAADALTIQFPEVQEQAFKDTTGIEVGLVFEHPHFLIINKPPYLSVHAPHKAHKEPSLVDWLIAHFRDIRSVGNAERPGIVHRLDKNTSGLLLISRNNYSHAILSDLFKNRSIKKTYHALVKGHPHLEGVLDFPLARDPFYRTKMTHKNSAGRQAITHYKVLEYFDDAALLELRPLTGRTHQIRVHCAAFGHPLLGDELYGTASNHIKRHALHASALEFSFEGQEFKFIQEMPQDFNTALNALRSR